MNADDPFVTAPLAVPPPFGSTVGPPHEPTFAEPTQVLATYAEPLVPVAQADGAVRQADNDGIAGAANGADHHVDRHVDSHVDSHVDHRHGAIDDSNDGGGKAPRLSSGPHAGAIVPLALAGAAVSVALGVYGRVHAPTGQAITTLGFPSVLAMKAWLGTIAFTLAAGQLLSALWLYGRLPLLGSAPRGLGFVHRWSGTAAFLVSLPVAYHCLWSLGFQDTGPRQLIHSLLGCAFYGAFATKLLALRSDRLPGWGLPVIGSTLVVCLTGLWLTSALWFFTTVGFPY